MGAVADIVEDAFDGIVALTVTVLTVSFPFLSVPLLSLCSDCKDFVLEQIGIVMGWFGITEEDIVETNVIDQRLISEDIVKSLMTQVALEHQDTQRGIIELLSIKTAKVRQQLGSYFDYGKNTYTNGLPDTNIQIPYVPLNIVVPLIETEFSHTITVITSKIAAPTKLEWCDYKLWQSYRYTPWNQELIYNTYKFKVDYINYNYTTNKYDVAIYRPAISTADTTITITPVDAINDNKNTTIITTLTVFEGVLSTSTTSTDELIPKDSEVDSHTIVNTNVKYTPTIISIVSYSPIRSMIVKFYWTNDTEYYHWVYQIGSGNTTLDNTNTYITNLEMLPIIELRNAKVNVNADKTSTKYLEAKEILDYIGINVDDMVDSVNENPNISDIEDAYIYFGMEVGSNDPLIAKMLYMLWEMLYYDTSLLTEDATGFVATVREGSYNSSLVWKTQTRSVINGIIGPIGTYTNEIGITDSVPWVKFRKQETEEFYVEYKITNVVATVYIDRGQFWGVVVKSTTNGPLIIPLSKHFIDQLTPIEQIEVFAKCLRLTVYALNVTHLDWYETPEFFQFVQIVLIVIAIAVFVLSMGAGFKLSTFLINLSIMIGASMALKYLLSTTDNPWLRALYTIIYVVVMAYTMNMDTSQIGFLTADQITQRVTEYTEMQMEALAAEAGAFGLAVATKMEELESKGKDLAGYLSTEFVAELSNTEPVNAFIEGPELNYYKAVQMQYDHIYLSIGSPYENMFDYDRYYRIGVV